jgi:hypothetical protein
VRETRARRRLARPVAHGDGVLQRPGKIGNRLVQIAEEIGFEEAEVMQGCCELLVVAELLVNRQCLFVMALRFLNFASFGQHQAYVIQELAFRPAVSGYPRQLNAPPGEADELRSQALIALE